VDRINRRFHAGHPSIDVGSAGVLIHQFDSLDDSNPHGEPWMPGAGQRGGRADRISAAIINGHMVCTIDTSALNEPHSSHRASAPQHATPVCVATHHGDTSWQCRVVMRLPTAMCSIRVLVAQVPDPPFLPNWARMLVQTRGTLRSMPYSMLLFS
jgi:hypothetical protein